MNKIQTRLLLLVLLAQAAAPANALSGCELTKREIQDLQTQARNMEIEISNSGIGQIQQLSKNIKQTCLDNISNINLQQGAWGSAISVAANQLCEQVASKVPRVNIDLNSIMNNPGQLPTSVGKQVVQQVVNQTVQQVQAGVTPTVPSAPSMVESVWDKIRGTLYSAR